MDTESLALFVIIDNSVMKAIFVYVWMFDKDTVIKCLLTFPQGLCIRKGMKNSGIANPPSAKKKLTISWNFCK